MSEERDEIKNQIKDSVLRDMDMSVEIVDEEVFKAIDRHLLALDIDHQFSLRERLEIRKDVYNSIRRLDVLSSLMDDDEVTEIMINGKDKIFVERNGRIYKTDKSFESEEKLLSVIQHMVSGANRMVNESSPIADLVLDDGSRVNVVLSGISCDGHIVTIRKFPKKIMDMKCLINLGAIDEGVAAYLRLLVMAGYNIFISGGTGAGKTTFLNALTEFIPKGERVITIEDSAELRVIGVDNLVRLEARNVNVEGKNEISIRNLIKSSLRMRPDRIIVGEVRDAAAVDMLQAMNTGHDGSLSTGHANSAHEMLLRLESMVLEGADLPLKAVRQQITSALDIVIHLGRLRDNSRRVLEIREVLEMKDDEIITKELFRFNETGEEDGRVLGYLEKVRDLVNVNKLKSAGLLSVYKELG